MTTVEEELRQVNIQDDIVTIVMTVYENRDGNEVEIKQDVFMGTFSEIILKLDREYNVELNSDRTTLYLPEYTIMFESHYHLGFTCKLRGLNRDQIDQALNYLAITDRILSSPLTVFPDDFQEYGLAWKMFLAFKQEMLVYGPEHIELLMLGAKINQGQAVKEAQREMECNARDIMEGVNYVN